jgi:hypothetical protein
MGLPVLLARDMVLEKGIVINGLPIMINDDDPFRGLVDVGLDVYYEQCVIGGSGAFIVSVDDRASFAEAIRRKMVLEIALQPLMRRTAPTLVQGAALMDCMIGERVRGYFGP